MGNRVFILFFLILALSFLFSAASPAILALRKRNSLRMGLAVWAVLFFAVTVPLNLGNSPVDLLLYDDWSGGLRVEVMTGREEAAEFYIPASVRTAVQTGAAILSGVWLTAAAASFSYGMSSYFNQVHFLTKRSKICRDARVNTIFEGAAAKAGIRRNVSLRVMDSGLKISPCTCGILSHSIFVGEDMLKEYSDEWLELVFLHEMIHIRHGDAVLKLLTLFVSSVHVFLPMSKRIRRAVLEDCEFRCDAGVLKNAGQRAGNTYMSVILDAAERNIREDCHGTDLLSSVSESGAFLLRRYRNMKELKTPKKPPLALGILFAAGLLCNAALMSAVDLPNVSNPGVDIADDLMRRALCEYFGLDDPEKLTAAHMDAVYSVAYEADDHRNLTGCGLRFTRRIVINEGLYLTEDGFLPPVLPVNGKQASCSVLPAAIREDMFDPRLYPEEFYILRENDPSVSPCSTCLPVYLLKPDLDGEVVAEYLDGIADSPEHALWMMDDRTADLRDLTLFTGLRSFGISDLLKPAGYELNGETAFAVIYEKLH